MAHGHGARAGGEAATLVSFVVTGCHPLWREVLSKVGIWLKLFTLLEDVPTGYVVHGISAPNGWMRGLADRATLY